MTSHQPICVLKHCIETTAILVHQTNPFLVEILFWEWKGYIYTKFVIGWEIWILETLGSRFFSISAKLQTSRSHKTGALSPVSQFEVHVCMAWPNSWGIKWFTIRSFKLRSKALQSHVWEKVLLFRALSLINCWTILRRNIILKTVSISAKIEVKEWMKTKMAAVSYQPRILSPKYEQMDNLKPLTVCSEMAKHRS